ncbi:MAG: ATP-binding protein [Pseudomonadota bacterium]
MILSPYGLGRPGIDLMTKTYIDTLVEGGVNAEHICVEFLNVNQEAAPELRRTRRDFLNKRYKGQHVDLIVTLHPPALRFLLEELPDLSVPAPVLAMTAPRPASTQGRRIFLQTSSPDYAGTISQALQLFPKTQRVVVLLGVGDADQVARRNVERAAAQWKGRLVFEYTDDLTLAQMRHRVANLPPDTILLCSSVNRDRTGDTIQQYDMARQAIRLANAPPFVLFSVTLGMGSVGGSVQHIEQDAARMGHRSLAILAGELRHSDAEDVMTLPSEPTPMYDWQALERWGADPDRLPPDTIFMNRPLSLWQQHRVTVQTTLAAFFILVLLLTALLVQQRRLVRAEARIRESEARYRVLVEHAPEAILVYDLDLGRIVDLNGKAEEMFGRPRLLLLQMAPEALYAAQQPDGLPPQVSIRDNAARSLAGAELLFERLVLRADGHCFPCEVRLVALPATGRRLTRGSYSDISARKLAEQELHRHRHHLEELVQQRTAALSVAVSAAQAANEAKNVFLSNMSHELRTPLNSVIGFSHMLAEADDMPEEARNKLAIINRSGQHLLKLINDILDLSKIEAGPLRLELQALDPCQLLQSVMAQMRTEAELAGVTLMLECSASPSNVLLDGAKLRQVMLSLLSNAIKFGKGGKVWLALHGRPRAGKLVELAFSVRDEGAGVGQTDQQRIFAPFVQAGMQGAQSGTGLGLSISREYVRLMGGELKVDSQAGQGAVFSFRIVGELLAGVAPVVHLRRTERVVGAAPLQAADLATLPEASRLALMHAVRNLDMPAAAAILSGLDPECEAAVAGINTMLRKYQYQQLWQMLQDG